MQIDGFKIAVLHETYLHVDGGILFGEVPREDWELFLKPDERNRVKIGVNQILVMGEKMNILIDAGIGTKRQSVKTAFLPPYYRTSFRKRLMSFGLIPEDITHVIFTHLHADHVGGALTIKDGHLLPVFPFAEYFVQKQEWDSALSFEGDAKRFVRIQDLLPLSAAGKIRLLNGDVELVKGIFLEVTGGHSEGHQMVTIKGEGKTFVFPGDICPTEYHVHEGINTAANVNPSDFAASKQLFLRKAVASNTVVAFPHSINPVFYKIRDTGENYVCEKYL